MQRRYDGHNEGSVSGRSSQVSGGSDRLKYFEKHCPRSLVFSELELAVVQCVGINDLSQLLMVFHNSLEFGFSLQTKAFMASLSFVTTLFLIFLHFTASIVEDFARLKYRFHHFIIFVRSLVSQGRFFLSGILSLEIYFSIVSGNASWNFVHAT